MKVRFCLAIMVLYAHDLFGNIFSPRKNLATRMDYPTKNTPVFSLGSIIVIVGIVSGQPVAQKLDDYAKSISSGNKEEDTYFFIEDDFLDMSYLELARAYQVSTPSGEDEWRAYQWKLAMVSITGDTFIKQ